MIHRIFICLECAIFFNELEVQLKTPEALRPHKNVIMEKSSFLYFFNRGLFPHPHPTHPTIFLLRVLVNVASVIVYIKLAGVFWGGLNLSVFLNVFKVWICLDLWMCLFKVWIRLCLWMHLSFWIYLHLRMYLSSEYVCICECIWVHLSFECVCVYEYIWKTELFKLPFSCLFASLFLYVYVCIYVYIYVCLCDVFMYIYLFCCLFVSSSAHMSVDLSFCLFACL